MAWLQQTASGTYHISFRFAGKKYKRSLGTKSERGANSKRIRLEDTIEKLESGWLEFPEGADVPTFLLTEGKSSSRKVEIAAPVPVVKAAVPLSLKKIFELYLDALPVNSLEATTIATMKIHQRHLERKLGKRFVLCDLSQRILTNYISKRSRDSGKNGRRVCGATIKKEVRTLSTLWKWAIANKHIVKADFPDTSQLRYPVDSEKPKFQPFADVVRQVESLGMDSDEAALLWESVFLSRVELTELLGFVKLNAKRPFIYPMFVIAAHTGVRRSELLRSQKIDFQNERLTVRERKRKRGTNSTRQVPLSTLAKNTIDAWFADHPGGSDTFCQEVQDVSSVLVEPINPRAAYYHFKKVLKNSKWEHLTGWHVLRHSFISNCACDGVDQRMIDEWVGHTTDAMRERYRHLFPNESAKAIKSVFG
jgi:integrase